MRSAARPPGGTWKRKGPLTKQTPFKRDGARVTGAWLHAPFTPGLKCVCVYDVSLSALAALLPSVPIPFCFGPCASRAVRSVCFHRPQPGLFSTYAATPGRGCAHPCVPARTVRQVDRQIIPSRTHLGVGGSGFGAPGLGGRAAATADSKLNSTLQLLRSVSLPPPSTSPPLRLEGASDGGGGGGGGGGGRGGAHGLTLPSPRMPGMVGFGLPQGSPAPTSVPSPALGAGTPRFGVSPAHMPPVGDDDDRPPLSASVHRDWRLLTSVRITSPSPLDAVVQRGDIVPATAAFLAASCRPSGAAAAAAPTAAPAGAPAAGVGGTFGAPPRGCRADSAVFTPPPLGAGEALLQGRMYWAYPDGPLPSAVLHLRARQDVEVVAQFRDRLGMWLTALRGLHRGLLGGTVPWFYVCVSAAGVPCPRSVAACAARRRGARPPALRRVFQLRLRRVCWHGVFLFAGWCVCRVGPCRAWLPHRQIGDSNVFLFRRVDGSGGSVGSSEGVEAVVARSSLGLRRRLEDADVAFSCPLSPEPLEDVDDEGYALAGVMRPRLCVSVRLCACACVRALCCCVCGVCTMEAGATWTPALTCLRACVCRLSCAGCRCPPSLRSTSGRCCW
jgi:hypothetical protein